MENLVELKKEELNLINGGTSIWERYWDFLGDRWDEVTTEDPTWRQRICDQGAHR